ncbi:hypothetical protein MATL_G00129980 [Megalops atlanticus]|uniref:CRIB domain-containing protein n=1 Tax=Megalops atlanticus TaxID=7932 RepID=A0A9D3TBV2_MEGAT|nr:hypothetical protein MATL_G00129980 [Megalops atlanticus]
MHIKKIYRMEATKVQTEAAKLHTRQASISGEFSRREESREPSRQCKEDYSAACRAARESQGFVWRTPGMSEFWHKMSCCVVAKPPPKKKRRKIDRSMIGEPMNFVHLTHIGSGEMTEGLPASGQVQEQMRSKGPSANGRNSLL